MSRRIPQTNEQIEAILANKKKSKPKKKSKAKELSTYWLKNTTKFIKELEGPSSTQYKQILKLYLFGAVSIGAFCYAIKVLHIPINNTLVA